MNIMKYSINIEFSNFDEFRVFLFLFFAILKINQWNFLFQKCSIEFLSCYREIFHSVTEENIFDDARNQRETGGPTRNLGREETVVSQM